MDFIPRTTNDDFWRNFESLMVWGSKAFALCPFLVRGGTSVVVYHKLQDLLESGYSDEQMVVQAWVGEYRTDYFHYRMDTLKRHLESMNNTGKLSPSVVWALEEYAKTLQS